jgi:PLD-like domain
MGQPQIRAYPSCDDALVVWRYDRPIAGSRGFALWRRVGDADAEAIHTFVPFAGQQAEAGEHRPSTDWPIQRFIWTDVFVREGDMQVSYRAVPMVRDGAGALRADEAHATGWSDPIDVGPRASDELSTYFNRGVVATQTIAHRLEGEQPWKRRLGSMIATPGDRTRSYLAGPVRTGLFELLDRVRMSRDAEIYAALFELDDPELLGYLRGLGSRAHVILANGAGGNSDENAAARTTLLDAQVDVRNRMTGSRLAHNKFLVVSDPADRPTGVWTGSTNWTMTGLCTQVNNALLIENADVAAYYRAQWELLAAAGSDFPPSLVRANTTRKQAALASGSVATWFVPVRGEVDLAEARELIARARDGILFLMFNPGMRDTLFNAIMNRTHPGDATYDADLYVHGVLNQDPSAGRPDSEFKLIRDSRVDPTDPAIVMPAALDERFGIWDREIEGYNIVMVHSKVIVLDPFGATPIVMTGSHNLGPRASGDNDDNLNIVTGVPRLAAAYAANIKAVYDAYRWRYVRSTEARAAGDDWDGPVDDDGWQDPYFSGPDAPAREREARFWLGA